MYANVMLMYVTEMKCLVQNYWEDIKADGLAMTFT